MPRAGKLSVSVTSLASKGLASPFINCSTKWPVPTLPGEISTWNIAASVWMWIASGAAAAAASARGGGVKRQPATTARMATARTNSTRIEPSNG